jgi:hypothetical protein
MPYRLALLLTVPILYTSKPRPCLLGLSSVDKLLYHTAGSRKCVFGSDDIATYIHQSALKVARHDGGDGDDGAWSVECGA